MMKLPEPLSQILFPPKCVLCGRLLGPEETDLCHSCRRDTQEHPDPSVKLPYLAQWLSLWYYEEKVRDSILRFKFCYRKSYAEAYGRLLAARILNAGISFDILTWVPISAVRKRRRSFDQVELIVRVVGRELGITPLRTLHKHRNNRPQSQMGSAAQRRANALGAYRCTNPEIVQGRRILLLDDILTTGATAGECAKTLLLAGAKAVICATVAAASHHEKKQ